VCQQVSSLQAEIRTQQTKIKETLDMLEQERNDGQGLRRTVSDIKIAAMQQASTQESKLAVIALELDATQRTLRNERTTVTGLNETVQQLSAELRAVEQCRTKAEFQVQALESNMTQMKESLTSKSEQLKRLQNEMREDQQGLSHERDAFRRQAMLEKEDVRRQLEEERSSFREQIEAVRANELSAASQFKITIANLEKAIQDSKATADQLTHQLKEKQSTLTSLQTKLTLVTRLSAAATRQRDRMLDCVFPALRALKTDMADVQRHTNKTFSSLLNSTAEMVHKLGWKYDQRLLHVGRQHEAYLAAAMEELQTRHRVELCKCQRRQEELEAALEHERTECANQLHSLKAQTASDVRSYLTTSEQDLRTQRLEAEAKLAQIQAENQARARLADERASELSHALSQLKPELSNLRADFQRAQEQYDALQFQKDQLEQKDKHAQTKLLESEELLVSRSQEIIRLTALYQNLEKEVLLLSRAAEKKRNQFNTVLLLVASHLPAMRHLQKDLISDEDEVHSRSTANLQMLLTEFFNDLHSKEEKGRFAIVRGVEERAQQTQSALEKELRDLKGLLEQGHDRERIGVAELAKLRGELGEMMRLSESEKESLRSHIRNLQAELEEAQDQIETVRNESMLETELHKVNATKPFKAELEALRATMTSMEEAHRRELDMQVELTRSFDYICVKCLRNLCCVDFFLNEFPNHA
jgi:chromosome segregation ATPase